MLYIASEGGECERDTSQMKNTEEREIRREARRASFLKLIGLPAETLEGS